MAGAVMLACGGAVFALLKGFLGDICLSAVSVALGELAVVAAILAAAGGYGWPLVWRISPRDAPVGLRVITAVLVGLWMLSTTMLAIGSAFDGAMTPWVWWPVILAGLALAGWHGRRRLIAWRPASRYDRRALVWVAVALAVGVWLAGATVPPGLIGGSDAYDILEYHLQIPREYFDAGRITPLRHNCYSFYPMGVEMLFLLAMALRCGAYEGMYLAKMMHGAFAALAVAAVFLSLRRDEDARGRMSAALLASTPFVLYLAWLAMVELAMAAYLAVALLWLREWAKKPCGRSAWCVGAMVGGACAVKYLSVGFVAAPVLAVMLVACIRRRRFGRLAHVAIVALAALTLWSPWLMRNAATTGNPVFPLATGIFGRGHWDEQTEKRWVDGHRPAAGAPVPVPDGWQPPRRTGRLENLIRNFVTSNMFGPVTMLLAAAAICVLLASRGPPAPWDGMLAGVCVVQLAVWIAFTRDMPGRFVMPIVVPICLLAGGVLAQLGRLRTNPFRKGRGGKTGPQPQGRWGASPARAVFIVAVGVNIFTAAAFFNYSTRGQIIPPVAGRLIAAGMPPFSVAADLPAGSKLLLVGDAKAFYFPPGTLYATAFDVHPLAELLDSRRRLTPVQVRRELRKLGVTHVLVNWVEVRRLARTYGYPASLTGGPEVFRRLGLRVVEQMNRPSARSTTRPAARIFATLYAVGDD